VRPGAVVTRLLLPCLLLLASPAKARAAKAVDGVVNLNTAPAEILDLLPGIGPAKAEAIVLYRKRHLFRTVDELVRIKGVGRKMVRRLRSHLAIAGPTTATATLTKPGIATTAEPPKPKPAPAQAARPPRCPPSPSPGQLAHQGPPRRLFRPSGRSQSRTRPLRSACPEPP
jgi:competence ComEA-like helix-hairpin-helix protein